MELQALKLVCILSGKPREIQDVAVSVFSKSIGSASSAVEDTLHEVERALDEYNGNNGIPDSFSEIED